MFIVKSVMPTVVNLEVAGKLLFLGLLLHLSHLADTLLQGDLQKCSEVSINESIRTGTLGTCTMTYYVTN